MLLKKTNIHTKLVREQFKKSQEDSVLNWIHNYLKKTPSANERILENLASDTIEEATTFDFDLLDSNRIFHEKSIRKICINYRLRFLDSRYFKGAFPQEALTEINELEIAHQTPVIGFKIMAPSKMFVLNKTDDPLLFASMGNGYYYLIHKWGNDLHPLRKLLMWPFKNFENLIFTILLSSAVTTMLIPDGLFTKKQTFSQDLMVFFFMFKSIAAVVLFYGFALGKNFNNAIWKCKFDKAQ